MYIAHYKSVNSSKEFYSQVSDQLDFTAQVEMNGERYTLQTTYLVSSPSVYKRIEDRAKELDVPFNIEIK